MARIKYSELLVDWLADLGYTHCFFVAGGNIMHLLDGVRSRMTCVPVVHEVAAGMAVEYFNAAEGEGKAFALVTAGPGLTNILTAFGGAYLESREMLVLGGQVKSTDLATGGIRQRGIQEIDGAAMAAPCAVASVRMEEPFPRAQVEELVRRGATPRKGPVFLEICLDVQGAPVEREALEGPPAQPAAFIGGLVPDPAALPMAVDRISELMKDARRPVWLLGGGVSRAAARAVVPRLRELGVPVQTTWNGLDRVGADEPFYFGRPNTWGMRYANVLIQQADLVVAFGTRLGLQQTGFNWQEFAPLAKVVQVDVDRTELVKGHPRIDLAVQADAGAVLEGLAAREHGDYEEWVGFCRNVKARLPLQDPENVTRPGYLDPYGFSLDLSRVCGETDVFVPCSSGGAATVNMQTFQQKHGQIVIGDKGSASMGYGLGGAIGAAFAHPRRRTVLTEGDGGFAQNMQELGTVAVHGLNLKTFLLSNEGYASIRMTQRNYFGGAYLGCDTKTGLGFPDWPALFEAFRIPAMTLAEGWADDEGFRRLFDGDGPAAFIVPVDPEQTYFPKISSRVTATGSMESNPLHLMSPDLPEDLARDVLIHLGQEALTP